MLYVPVTQLDMVAKYIGPKEDSRVKLNDSVRATGKRQRQGLKPLSRTLPRSLLSFTHSV